ncbi:MAG: hypothetical protein JETT_0386 [Candidatus Jettenia ecosi]|uniref:Uncharacterized protein n=1 Tax=Candidatus Jettenia ecosi TaxID=2494326 RepID=A0A533QKR9_9BACT|nr:MAG: hypothetical protein JETT_0386 [Candidatus Jettenia ecosi]
MLHLNLLRIKNVIMFFTAVNDLFLNLPLISCKASFINILS